MAPEALDTGMRNPTPHNLALSPPAIHVASYGNPILRLTEGAGMYPALWKGSNPLEPLLLVSLLRARETILVHKNMVDVQEKIIQTTSRM
jgi:hypothetical protein